MKAAKEIYIAYDGQTCDKLIDMFYDGKEKNRKKYTTITKFGKEYLNGVLTFDTETTTITLENYKITGEDGKEIDVSKNKAAFVSVWMFCILGECVVYGRTTEDLKTFISELQEKIFPELEITVYVHNLYYDWYFLKRMFTWSTEGSFVTGNTDFYTVKTGRITMKDSVKYSNANLDNTVKNCPHQKAVGLWDYDKIRTPLTPLSDNELKYAVNDVLSLWEYLEDMRMNHGKSVKKMPLTFTRDIKDNMIKYIDENYGYKKYYYNYFKPCVTSLGKDIESYTEAFLFLRKIFYGGFCETSFFKKNKLLRNVGHKDYTSDYPFQMVSRKFPTKWFKTKIDKKYVERCLKKDDAAFMCYFRFKNVQSKRSFGWLPVRNILNNRQLLRKKFIETLHSKLYKTNKKYIVDDKGNVTWEDTEIVIPLNEVQFKTFSMVYDYEDWDVYDEEPMYIAPKTYLPDVAREFILDLFEKKSTLKGIPDKAYEYSQSKVGINGLYGMSVSNPVRLEHELTPEGEVKAYYKEENDKGEEIKVYVDHENAEIPVGTVTKQIVKTYIEKNHPIFPYHVGVWVTSYAQNQLLEDICYLDERGDYVTADTDSDFFTNPERHEEHFKAKNDWIISLNEAATKGLKHTYRYKNQKGKESILGVYTDELPCAEFKTLRSKTYIAGFSSEYFTQDDLDNDPTLVKNKKTGLVYQATVCGIAKSNLIQYFNKISEKENITIMSQFNDEMSVPADETGKKVGKRHDLKEPITISGFDDGYVLEGLQTYITLEPTPFSSLASVEETILSRQRVYNKISEA